MRAAQGAGSPARQRRRAERARRRDLARPRRHLRRTAQRAGSRGRVPAVAGHRAGALRRQPSAHQRGAAGLARVLLGAGKLEPKPSACSALAQDSLLARWGRTARSWPSRKACAAWSRSSATNRPSPSACSPTRCASGAAATRSRRTPPTCATWRRRRTNCGRDEQADGNRRECLDALRGKAHPDPRSAIAALVHATHAALDRRDLVEARSWLAQLPVPQPDTPGVRLVMARVAQIDGDADRSHEIENCWSDLPTDRSSRRLRWQAQAMLAAQACMDGRMGEGLTLRAARWRKWSAPSRSMPAAAAAGVPVVGLPDAGGGAGEAYGFLALWLPRFRSVRGAWVRTVSSSRVESEPRLVTSIQDSIKGRGSSSETWNIDGFAYDMPRRQRRCSCRR